MKVTKFPLPRKYLRRASVYRRAAGRNEPYDFSLAALIACYNYESTGGDMPINNGYIIGKRWLDLSIETWREDIMAGLFCKADFISPITKWYAERAMSDWIVPAWFPYEEELATRSAS